MTFHYESDLELTTRPLVEAWLEIQWDTHPNDNVSEVVPNRGFDVALGLFASSIKPDFEHIERLEAAQLPYDFVPEVVRFRFRNMSGSWPLIQIGSGVATVNFVDDYDWALFKDKASYLRHHLLSAYTDAGIALKGKSIILRYRNAESVDYPTESALEFLRSKLNTEFKLPDLIPGGLGTTGQPNSIDFRISFPLSKPKGTGSLQFVTGLRGADDAKVLIWETGIGSVGDDTPPLDDETAFKEWLTEAHAVLHEWFFALIEGELRGKYN